MISRLKCIGILLAVLVTVFPLQGQDEEEEASQWTGNVSLGLSLNLSLIHI